MMITSCQLICQNVRRLSFVVHSNFHAVRLIIAFVDVNKTYLYLILSYLILSFAIRSKIIHNASYCNAAFSGVARSLSHDVQRVHDIG